MTKIQETDTMLDSLTKMAEGNPGAITVLMQIMTEAERIDPDSFMGSFGAILSLDTQNIYGSRIWMLYKDVCGENITDTIGLSRAVQMGIISIATLNMAIDNYGKGLDVEDTMKKLRNDLPNFAK